MKKKKYDTSVVMLYLIGKEHLLPREFRRKIPYSTVASWRRTDYSSYSGQEYRIFFEDRINYLVLKKECREKKPGASGTGPRLGSAARRSVARHPAGSDRSGPAAKGHQRR